MVSRCQGALAVTVWLAGCGWASEGTPEAATPRPAAEQPSPAAEAEPPPRAGEDEGEGRGGLARQVAEVREALETAPPAWSTYQGNVQRTGWLPSAPVIRAPRVRWTAQVGIQGYLNGPLLVGSAVVVPTAGTRHNQPDAMDGLHAVDARTGAERWHARSKNDANGATVVGTQVVFTSDDGTIRAVDPGTGAERWSVQRAGAVYSTPVPLGSRVVVGDANGAVFALEAETGALAWEQTYTGAIRGGLSSDGTQVFVVSQGGDVAAIDGSGVERWRKAVTRAGWNGSGVVSIEGYDAPVVDGARLIVPFARDTYYETGPALLALSTVDGRELWRARPGTVGESWGNLRSSPALAEGVLVWAEPYSGDVAALDTATGIVRYRVTVGDCLFPQYGSPGIAGDTAYVPRQDGRLTAMAVDTGVVRWVMDLSASATAGPVRPPSGSGTAAGGGCEWEAAGGSPLYAPPAIASDGTVFVGSGEGVLYAIEDAEAAR